MLSIPITSHVSYIHCNHKPGPAQTSRLPYLAKAEAKLVATVARAWTKLVRLESRINRLIVRGVRKLLASVPYDENCLSSFPSKQLMIREINHEHVEAVESELGEKLELIRDKPETNRVLTSDVAAGTVQLHQLDPIPVYHPRFQAPQAVLHQLHQFRDVLGARHRRLALWCGAGIPLTLPFALVPVVPNVPGFYLAYRLYCHIRALRGVKNLGYLLETDSQEPGVDDTTHLTFRAWPELDSAYLADATFRKVEAPDADEGEQILLTPAAIDRLAAEIGLPALADELHRALAQELARIRAALAADTVE